MSDLSAGVIDPNDPENIEPPEPSAFHKVRETLTETIKAKNTAEQELAQARRDLAIERSALPEFPGKKFFIDNYQGEATPEAIRTAATEAGFVLEAPAEQVPAGETGGPPNPAISPTELQAHRAVAQAGAGSTNSVDIPLEDAIRSAKNPEELMKILAQAPPEAGIAMNPRNSVV